MPQDNTVFARRLKFATRHEFDKLAQQHHVGGKLRKTSRWNQFTALMLGHLTGRTSLRDIESNLNAQHDKLYHLGISLLTLAIARYAQTASQSVRSTQHTRPGMARLHSPVAQPSCPRDMMPRPERQSGRAICVPGNTHPSLLINEINK